MAYSQAAGLLSMADVDGIGRLYNASMVAKQADRPSYLSGFASSCHAAYLGVEHDPVL
jgi:hypothetical protein